MTRAGTDTPLDRLVPDVLDHVTERFDLRHDLDHLGRVQRVEAPEAIIFYCGRILEALTAAALEQAALEPSTNLFSNLQTLQQYSLVPTATQYWAHALRRVSNLVRHLQRRVGATDAELAVLFAERWLEWFFREYPWGRKLPALTQDGAPLRLNDCDELRVLMRAVEDLDRHLDTILAQVGRGHQGPLLRASVLPAVVTEMLLDRDDRPTARLVLDAALSQFRDDLRLQQLDGLCHSRSGNLSEALKCLEPLYERFRDDDETAGILAGVYKRLWNRENDRRWLERSQRVYRQGWDSSRRTSAYLGINAAATALWLGKTEVSRRIAVEVRSLVQARLSFRVGGAAAPGSGASQPALNFWDQITLAEAALLAGDLENARLLYRTAMTEHAEQHRAGIDVSRQQLDANLRALGRAETAAEFLGQLPAAGEGGSSS